MFGFAQWDSAGALIAEFMLSVVVVVAIVLIVNRVNRNQVPPASQGKPAPAGTNSPSAPDQSSSQAPVEPKGEVAFGSDSGDGKT